MTIRALVVDDEKWARRRIITLLRDAPDFSVAGECASGEEAVESIAADRPDVVFLDVQMPEMTGLEVLEMIERSRLPLIVFVTAYDQYAIQAFDAAAIDYLLKPFDEDRFRQALDRIRGTLAARRMPDLDTLQGLLASAGGGPRYLKRIAVRSGDRVVVLRSQEVDWFESARNYVAVHAGKSAHTVRTTISVLESKLDPERFVRIHRSTIVNLDRVAELQPWFNGEQVLLLKDGTRLTVGRLFRDRLAPLLQNVP